MEAIQRNNYTSNLFIKSGKGMSHLIKAMGKAKESVHAIKRQLNVQKVLVKTLPVNANDFLYK